MSTPERLNRLLFIVPYVASRDGVPLAELADKLGVSVSQIEADVELLAMVGRPPLTPDHLIDLYVEDDVVYVDLDQSLSRPPRLTHEEGRALVLAAKLSGQGAPGADLERVLGRVLSVLNPVDREAVTALAQRVGVWRDAPGTAEHAAELLLAIDTQREVEITYYSASSDQKKRYRLQPLALITHAGVDYLVALDTGQEAHEKLFRLDRMREVAVAAERFTPPEIDLERFRTDRLYFGSGGQKAEVRFSPAVARLVAERFADAAVTAAKDGSVRVVLDSTSPAWLARWVLPFGQDAEVVAPAEARALLQKLCVEALAAYSQ